MTRRRLLAGLLTLIMVLQALVPGAALAKSSKPLNDNLITIGKLTKKDYPQIDKDTALRVAREQKNKRKGFLGRGTTLFSADSPYIPGQQPGDADKPKYLANITGKVEAKGLDGGNFDWNKIFGDKPIKLELRQLDKTKLDKQTNPLGETGLILTLEVSKAGEFKLTDRAGNLTDLPLFSAEGNPFEYQIQVDRKSYENVELIISTNAGTPGSSFQPVGEKQIATLSFTIGIQQLASTKFTSEWHTGVAEANRPQIEGYFKVGEDLDNDFNFPKNDTTRTILRSGFLENFVEDEENGPWAFIDSELEAAPKSVEVKTDTAGLTFEENNGVKTVEKDGHKFKYDFAYDVIDGGKLTMTEVIPVTFDANGGTFASIPDPNAEQMIKKEVDYDGTLIDKAENPTKDRETFKGWGTKDAQGNITPITEDVFKNIKEAKTLYAIWDNNAITADELTVHESYKNGTDYVNDFIPKIEDLKKQVKIKDGNGVLQALKGEDKFAIVDGSNEYKDNGDALKNYLYEKLQEKGNPNDEPTRVETVKVKVTHANGTSQTVDIPIKVIKNIYEAKTLTEKPFYVPEGYVKVTLDPTTKATVPQKTYYYVNPAAKVVIPGEDPTGVGDNKFVKWTMKADSETGDGADYAIAERHKFTEASTIEAQYVSDVIPQEGTEKPDTVPANFVEVKFVPTEKATEETKAEKIFWVNPEKAVTIPVKNPVGKQYFTFKEWKMGANADGATYTPSTAQKFTEPTTVITATYDEAKNIIPYNPEEPITRPDGYVRVTFAADPGLKLTEQKAYYVKQNAKDEHGTDLTLASLAKPTYEAQTGYKFDKWDKKDSLVIEAADIVVTAKATKLDNVIPEKKEDGTPNEKPKGYNTVTFVIKADDEAKGSIKGVTKFYVNPTEYVNINPPEAKPNTGYVFGSWDKDTTIPTVYDKDTTITGSFNELGAVIPKTNPDGTENKQPAGYVRVTFMAIGEGYIPTGETRVYFVNPEKEVTITPPKAKGNTGYEFNKWNQDTTESTRYPNDTIVTANFKKLDAIIPSTDGDGKPNPKPEGYVTVTFLKGNHGELSGQTIYYVNPKAVPTKKLGDPSIVKPTVTPEIGYTFDKWSIDDKELIKNNKSPVAGYKELPDVVPKDNPGGGENKQPNGYITVTFSTETNGKIKGTDKTEKVVYVNPNKAVALDKFAPQVDPNTGFTFADWDTSITKAIQYKDGDVIKAKYNPIGAVIPKKSDDTEKPAGYVTVTFDKGTNGKSITGTTVYYVDPNKEVTVTAPAVTPNTGYKQKTGAAAWDKALTQKFTAENTTITAQYEEIGDVIPQVNTDGSDKPNGYVTVTFKAVNGSLEGTTTYYVNGEKEVDLTNTADGLTKKADVGYTADGGTWDKALKAKFKDGDELTFTFKALDDVIKVTPGATQPEGYVTVKLIPTEKATDDTKAEKSYWVNPTKEVTITSKPVGKTETKEGIKYTYNFNGWKATIGTIASWDNENITGKFIQNTEITAQYTTEVKIEKLIPAPVPKKNVVTPKGDVPDAKDLIGNPYNPQDPTNKNNLPNGTKITYEKEPDVTNPGTTTAKVKIEYPNGKKVVVEVPITVVDNVVPQTGKDKPNVPANYVKVTFVIDPAGGGTIADGQTTIYYVNPKQDVTIDPPQTKAETGYSFAGWNPNTKEAKKYESDTTVKGSFTKGNDIIPATNEEGKSNDKPEGYVTVTFDKGANGSLEGQTVYYVNPKAGKTLKDVTHPAIKPDTGFTANGWDKEDTTEIKSDITVTARYNPIDDVIPKTKDDESEKPDGYVTVTFNTTDIGGNVTKVVFVNPKKAVVLSGFEPKGFEVKNGYEFARWDISIDQAIQYKDGTVITALYNNPNDISTKEIAGYVKVEFKPGEHGSLSGPTTYWVKPGAEVYLPSPAVKANDGYRFDKWDKSLSVKFEANAPTYVITAQYEKQKPVDPTPELRPYPVPGDCNNTCDQPNAPNQPNQPNQPNVGKDALNTTDHYQYLIGYPDGNFGPNKGMTRAEAATMFTRLLNERPVKWRHYDAGLSDIRPGDWYANTVGYAVQRGIVSGYPDGSFKPNKPITRAEFAAIASRFDALAQGNAISFSDLAPSHWGYNAIRSAATKGWISGYPDNTFRPEQAITRAEVTAITNRMLNRHADLYWIDAHPSEVIRFGDVKRSDWYFEPIMEATMGHDFIRDRDKKTEHWTGINGKSFI